MGRYLELRCNPTDGSLPGSSVYRIFPAKVTGWVSFSSQGSLPTRNWTWVSRIEQANCRLSHKASPRNKTIYRYKNSFLSLVPFLLSLEASTILKVLCVLHVYVYVFILLHKKVSVNLMCDSILYIYICTNGITFLTAFPATSTTSHLFLQTYLCWFLYFVHSLLIYLASPVGLLDFLCSLLAVNKSTAAEVFSRLCFDVALDRLIKGWKILIYWKV